MNRLTARDPRQSVAICKGGRSQRFRRAARPRESFVALIRKLHAFRQWPLPLRQSLRTFLTFLRVSWERATNLVDTAMYLAKAHGGNRAYGVRVLQARDETSLEAITRSLESAWRDGQVTLTLLQGRTPLAAAA